MVVEGWRRGRRRGRGRMGDLCGAKRTVTGGEGRGGRFTHFRGKRHGIEPETDEDYKV